jgi:hypothetical protein
MCGGGGSSSSSSSSRDLQLPGFKMMMNLLLNYSNKKSHIKGLGS